MRRHSQVGTTRGSAIYDDPARRREREDYQAKSPAGPACASSITIAGEEGINVQIPSGEVKLNRGFTLKADATTTIELDFDSDRSIPRPERHVHDEPSDYDPEHDPDTAATVGERTMGGTRRRRRARGRSRVRACRLQGQRFPRWAVGPRGALLERRGGAGISCSALGRTRSTSRS